MRVLKCGSRGWYVKRLQKRLINLMYDCGPWGADGVFGEATERALKKFQSEHTDVSGKRLVVDGIYGPKTQWALLHPRASYISPAPPPAKSAKKWLCVDAGHGGYDPGAVGSDGTEEADLNLKVAARFASAARAAGLEVILTRDGDFFVPLHQRALIANQNECSLFLSFHHNSATDTSAKGAETYFWGRDWGSYSKSGHECAVYIQVELLTSLQSRDRGIHPASFQVLRETRMTAVLIEPGFISNVEEREFLKKEATQEEIAQATLRGVQRYFGLI